MLSDLDDIVEIEDLAFCSNSIISGSIFWLLQNLLSVSIYGINFLIDGSFDVDMDERRFSIALEW